MRMTSRLLLAALFAIALHAPAGAQTPGRIVPQLADAFAVVAGDVAASSQAMPAEKYGYRPSPETRSFGQIVAHLSGAHYLYCSQASGQRLTADLGKRLGPARLFSDVETEAKGPALSKNELVELLNSSIAYCQAAYQGMSDESLKRAAIDNVAHTNEHYGNLVTYLRLNGVIPPSTTRRAGQR
jgi:hypothetical protein